MKKYIVITLVIAFVAAASSAFAAGTNFTPTSTTQIAGANFIPSTSVTLNASAIDTNYCVTTLHASSAAQAAGKQWGALNTDSTIKFIQPAPSTIAACGSATAMPSGTWQQ